MESTLRVAVIGAGFAGMTTAALLAQQGYAVEIFEKNHQPGGRCGLWEQDGFRFDMGPSWYWMPDVFEKFFERMGTSAGALMQLRRLDPSYQVVYSDETWKIPADYDQLVALISQYESDAQHKLDKFLEAAKKKYQVGVQDLVYKPSLSWAEYINSETIKGALRLNLFGSFRRMVYKHFKNPKVRQLMEFPVLFLGAKPAKTPALFSLMNYADIKLGTWYPMGGMHELARSFEHVAKQAGVQFRYAQPVEAILTDDTRATGIQVSGRQLPYDIIISSADYEHTEQHLLPESKRNYTARFWERQQMSPSSLLYFLGIKKRIPGLEHHNLFFDADFDKHAEEIYDSRTFPTDPLFYLCAPSVTDASVAPADSENLFVLIPLAPDLEDTAEIRSHYLDEVISRIEQQTGVSIKEDIVVRRDFGVGDFKSFYNSYKGNAYGLANTLSQTGPQRPRIINKNLIDLYYCGQLSVPGPGMPPAVISGTIVADYILQHRHTS